MRQIFDYEGYPVNFSEELEEEEIKISMFIKPSVIDDVLKEREVKPEIVVFDDNCTTFCINTKKICIYAKEIPKSEVWTPHQRYVYFLRHDGVPVEEGCKEMKIIPLKHYIVMDIANHKVKLYGCAISKERYCTDWLEY